MGGINRPAQRGSFIDSNKFSSRFILLTSWPAKCFTRAHQSNDMGVGGVQYLQLYIINKLHRSKGQWFVGGNRVVTVFMSYGHVLAGSGRVGGMGEDGGFNCKTTVAYRLVSR